VLDTAPLVALLGGARRSLGREAARAWSQVESGRGQFAVPTVCLFEIAQLEDKGTLTLGVPFEDWCDLVEQAPGLVVMPLDRRHVSEARALPTLRDPFDRLIAGTAVALGVPLVTADARISAHGRVRVLW
jgi:PIN domain nuclease of toxin-antitoxin system